MISPGFPESPRKLAYGMLGLVMLFWAGNSIVGRAVVGEVPPFTLAFLRWTGALLLLLPFAWPALRRDRDVLQARWRTTLILGLLGVGAFNGLLYSGLTHTTASNALLMQAAIPPLVLLLDRMCFGSQVSARQAAGTTLSVLGVIVVVLRGDLLSVAQVEIGTGELLVLCAVLAWAAYTVGLRLRPDVAGTSFLAATFAVGVGAMAPFALVEWLSGATIDWSPKTVSALGYVAVFPSLIAYLLFNRATQIVGPGQAGLAIAMMPLIGALLASITLGEDLRAFHWIGMLLIVSGMLVAAGNRKYESDIDR